MPQQISEQQQQADRLAYLMQRRNVLQHAAEVLSADALQARDPHKAPQSIFLRQSMALDLLIWRLRAERESAEARRAELAGIRVVYRVWKRQFIECEDKCFRLLEAADRLWLEYAPVNAGGVQ